MTLRPHVRWHPRLTAIPVEENAHLSGLPPRMQSMNGAWPNRFGWFLTHEAPEMLCELLGRDAKLHGHAA